MTIVLSHVILSPSYQRGRYGMKRIIYVTRLHHDGIYEYGCRHLVVVMHPLQVQAKLKLDELESFYLGKVPYLRCLNLYAAKVRYL